MNARKRARAGTGTESYPPLPPCGGPGGRGLRPGRLPPSRRPREGGEDGRPTARARG